jgi:hypothetical protein
MVLVRVFRISSSTDPLTHKPGKQVELVEVRRRGGGATGFSVGEGDEARVVHGIITQFQSMGVFPQVREMVLPKITLLLSEEEYEALGIRFEVNDVYELSLKAGTITFQRASEVGITP